jgi:4-hydroxy-tetrahydrodipicolinate synthase
MFNLTGISVAAVTPFDQEGHFDEKAFRTLLNWWLTQGIHGIVACGTTGEVAYLSHAERERIFEVAVEHVKGRVPIIAGTGFASTNETIEMTNAAAKIGVDLALIITPFYYPASQKMLFAHFKKVAERSKIPVLLYNNPQVTHVKLEAETVAELSKLDNIIGIKDSAGDWALLEKIIKLSEPDFIVYSGSLKLVPSALAAGADGGILAIASLAPALCVELYQLCKQEKTTEAETLHEQLLKLIEGTNGAFGIPGLKTALGLLGMPAGYPRMPMLPLGSDNAKKVQKTLQELNLLTVRA